MALVAATRTADAEESVAKAAAPAPPGAGSEGSAATQPAVDQQGLRVANVQKREAACRAIVSHFVISFRVSVLVNKAVDLRDLTGGFGPTWAR